MIWPRKLNVFLPTLLILSATAIGCGHRVVKNMTDAPDGIVERLVITDAGELTSEEGRFLELVRRKDQKLVLVDFWADWCGPCKMLAPSLKQLKKDWGDRLEVVKVNVDSEDCQQLAQFFEISSIPDVRIFRAGSQVSDFTGVMPRQEIESLLKSLE
ncbi:MAG: thioredoxin family protein [Planctomycetota bacterium]